MARKCNSAKTKKIKRVGKSDSKITVYSFFSCSGFLDLGFELVKGRPYQLRMANEPNEKFCQCYKYAREHLAKPIDVPDDFIFKNSVEDFLLENGKPQEGKEKIYARFTDLLNKDRKANKLIGFIGGPPCPDFSVAGRNLGKDGKVGPLSSKYIELICQECPDFFLFENVRGLYSSAKHREYFDYICGKLRHLYAIDVKVLNALWYGVPQSRERLIMIGVRKDLVSNMTDASFERMLHWSKFQSFDKEKLKNVVWPKREPFTGKRDVDWPDGYDYIKPLTVLHCWTESNVEKHPNHQNQTKPRPGNTKFMTIPEGNAKGKSYQRLHRFRYAPTAAYGNNEVPLHPWEPRRISIAEALATQSLPPDFSFPTDMGISALFKAVGNGVPYKMASGLAQMIYKFLLKNVLEVTNE